jgi:hypothetical protein
MNERPRAREARPPEARHRGRFLGSASLPQGVFVLFEGRFCLVTQSRRPPRPTSRAPQRGPAPPIRASSPRDGRFVIGLVSRRRSDVRSHQAGEAVAQHGARSPRPFSSQGRGRTRPGSIGIVHGASARRSRTRRYLRAPRPPKGAASAVPADQIQIDGQGREAERTRKAARGENKPSGAGRSRSRQAKRPPRRGPPPHNHTTPSCPVPPSGGVDFFSSVSEEKGKRRKGNNSSEQ